MFDHVSVGVNDVAKARQFYDDTMAALGMKVIFDMGDHAVAYGTEHPEFWVQLPFDQQGATAGNGTHVCFRAASRAMVDAFHAAGLQGGGNDDGAPGLRPDYHENYYGAFVKDLDGNKLEAVCHDPA